MGSSMNFHKAIRIHGEHNFELRILKENVDLDILSYTEEYFISKYDSIRNGYNVSPGGQQVSADTAAKISKANKGRIFSESHKRKLTEANKRRYLNETPEEKEERRLKMVGKGKGRKASEATKAKLRAALKLRVWKRGYKTFVSPEGQARIVAGCKAAMTGVPKTEAHKRAMRKPKSEAGRLAIKQAQQARRQREVLSRLATQFNTQTTNLQLT